MLKRTILDSLVTWAEAPHRKPLILRGARQVGKTTIVNQFSKRYDKFLSLNLELKGDRDLFEQDYDVHKLISAIHFHKGELVDQNAKTLIFIDEIQNSPVAANMLRYFYEERNDIHVIAAGSLLETLIDRRITFPVGRVEYQWMYPLSFREFLYASEQETVIEMLDKIPCPEFAHQKLLQLFHEYSQVGGMPEAVEMFLENRDVLAVNKVHANLLTAYMDDVEKYAPSKAKANVIRHVIEHASLEAGGRIKFEGFGQSHYKSKEIGESLRILEKALLIQLIYPSIETMLPATNNHKKSPKLQFLDTGIMNYAAGLQEYFFKLEDLNTLYRGRVSENLIGQEMIVNNMTFNGQLKFWVREKKQSNAEVDFIIPYEHFIIPIEVKSGKMGTLKSLMQFMELADHPYAVRLYAGKQQLDTLSTPSNKKFKLLSLPYYLVSKLPDYLKDMVHGI